MTAITLAIFGMVMIMGMLSWAVCLWLGARWAKIETTTIGRALIAAVLATIVGGLAYFDDLIVPQGALANSLVYQLGRFAVALLAPIAVVMAVFGTDFFRAVRAWLCTLPAPFLLLPFFIFVFRPYVSEAFVATANSMAPTIRGEHIRGVCPRCGAEAVSTPPQQGPYASPQDIYKMICSEEMTSCDVAAADTDPLVYPGDRFIVSKLIEPQRWDIIAFRLPEDPSVNYVKRLVGLPGETVEIDDGAVWIDGKRMTPPSRQHYVDKIGDGRWNAKMWGTRRRPAKLGDGEYFVLGDFSERASDSRMWAEGAPGHPSYAVPESHILGVVTHIYAPRDRLRAFR